MKTAFFKTENGYIKFDSVGQRDKYKASKRGRLALLKTGDVWETKREEEVIPERNALVTVFENGDLVKEYTFTTVRNNAAL